MDDARIGALLHLLAQDGGGVILRITRMDDKWQASLSRGGDMGSKADLLACAVAMIVIIIKPGLADGDDTRMRGHCHQLGGIDMGMGIGFMWMDADAGPDVVLTLGRADNLSPFALAGGDVQHRPHASCAGARQDARLILDETFIVEMAMAIDQHHSA